MAGTKRLEIFRELYNNSIYLKPYIDTRCNDTIYVCPNAVYCKDIYESFQYASKENEEILYANKNENFLITTYGINGIEWDTIRNICPNGRKRNGIDFISVLLDILDSYPKNIRKERFWGYSQDNVDNVGIELCKILSQVNKGYTLSPGEAVLKASELQREHQYENVIDLLTPYLGDVEKGYVGPDYNNIYYGLALAYYCQGKLREALDLFEANISYYKKIGIKNILFYQTRAFVVKISTELNDVCSAYNQFLELNEDYQENKLKLSKKEKESFDDIFLTSLQNSSLFESYKDKLAALPYSERKVLAIYENRDDLKKLNKIAVLPKDCTAGLSFPGDYPRTGIIYIGHPFLPKKYYPIESYKLELVEDKIREFTYLAQHLGATEVIVECLNTTSEERSFNSSMNVSGQVNSFSSSYSNNSRNHFIEELSQSISLHQTFTPKGKPVVPDHLIWYQHEPSWQKLVAQRMEGNLLSHEEKIETRHNQMIEDFEMNEIRVQAKIYFASLSMAFDRNIEQKFQQQENAVISIKIKFAPLELLENFNTQNGSNVLTTKEQEYLDEYLDIISSGEISDRDKRYLEKIKTANGISESRVVELQAMACIPKLSEKENEYFEEYKDMLCEGTLSGRNLRFLKKIKEANCISEDRARELEQMAQKALILFKD